MDISEQLLDAIWGAQAQGREGFGDLVERCVKMTNIIAVFGVRDAVVKPDKIDYEKQYLSAKSSGNRKVVLAKVEALMKDIREKIDAATDEPSKEPNEKLSAILCDYEKNIADICGAVGVDAPQFQAQSSPKEGNPNITKQELSDLYALLLVAYEKYKRCVQDNNMFAAFPTFSDFGQLNETFNERENDDEAVLDSADYQSLYKTASEQLSEQNEQKYLGLLDEDFVPHVDAFWSGLQAVCALYDNRFASADDNETYSRFAGELLINRLRRAIMSRSYQLNEDRWAFFETLHEKLTHDLQKLREELNRG